MISYDVHTMPRDKKTPQESFIENIVLDASIELLTHRGEMHVWISYGNLRIDCLISQVYPILTFVHKDHLRHLYAKENIFLGGGGRQEMNNDNFYVEEFYFFV